MERKGTPLQIRLSHEDKVILEELQGQTGLNQSEVLRLALRAAKDSLDSREQLVRMRKGD